MNGVFKFRENLFLKHKKGISVVLGTALAVTVAIRLIPATPETTKSTDQAEPATEAPVIVEAVVEANGYTVLVDGKVLGVVKTMEDGQTAMTEAFNLMRETLGYEPDIAPELTFEENFSLEDTFVEMEVLAGEMKDEMIAGLDEIKVKAFVMKIGEDFTVAMKSADEIKEVLRNAQSIYMNSADMDLDIALAVDSHNSLVMTPQVTMVKAEAADVSRNFTGTDGTAIAQEDVVAPVDEKDPKVDGETVNVSFAEEVLIVETYVFADEIKDVAVATELITKENDEPKLYKIKSGDAPSIIAENHNMPLSELYKMNPDLKGNERKMQIGDELVVMIPEPELSVATDEQVVYTEPISRGTTYVDNPDKYVGWTTTIDNGRSGTMRITAIVSKVNGEEVDRKIVGQEVISEPEDRVVSKGTKPLPPKGATGKYISPLSEYRITSPFGWRWGSMHQGIDLAAPTGTPVLASDGGTVTKAGWYGNYGYLVEIDHGNGVTTRYGHNSKINVSVGDTVSQYQTIAKCGNTGRSTGPHVHFEIRFDGVPTNPANYVDF